MTLNQLMSILAIEAKEQIIYMFPLRQACAYGKNVKYSWIHKHYLDTLRITIGNMLLHYLEESYSNKTDHFHDKSLHFFASMIHNFPYYKWHWQIHCHYATLMGKNEAGNLWITTAGSKIYKKTCLLHWGNTAISTVMFSVVQTKQK